MAAKLRRGVPGMSDEQTTGHGSPSVPEPIQVIVGRFDDVVRSLDCHEVSSAIRKEGAPSDDPADQAESFAFGVHPHTGENPSPWGTHFGPFMTWSGENGMMHESPGRDQITGFAIDYWWNRAQTVRHPVLRGRYADLVWDLSRRAERKSADRGGQAPDRLSRRHREPGPCRARD